MKNPKIEFQGKEYRRVGDAVAPLEHCDENGELKSEHTLSDSFAHIFPDGVYRYGEKIGEVNEVLEIE